MNYRRLFELNGIVFITFVTFNRCEILIPNIQILRYSFYQTKQKYQFDIIAICVLKNHIHMLIKPKKIIDYPNIIKNIKCNFSSEIDISTIENYSTTKSRIKKGEKSIWQRRYWEHTIRDEFDFNKHLDYIHYNPVKHYNIKPKDWEYSSFKKFVQLGFYDENWCNFENKYNIDKLNYE